MQHGIVNLSLCGGPYTYNRKDGAGQRNILLVGLEAASYAREQGVLIHSSGGDAARDLMHPGDDHSNLDWAMGIAG